MIDPWKLKTARGVAAQKAVLGKEEREIRNAALKIREKSSLARGGGLIENRGGGGRGST